MGIGGYPEIPILFQRNLFDISEPADSSPFWRIDENKLFCDLKTKPNFGGQSLKIVVRSTRLSRQASTY